jgi:hypothetical protein
MVLRWCGVDYMADRYDIEARHAPAALTVLPAIVAGFYLVPEFKTSIILPASFATVAVAAIYALLARVARARGIEVQEKLYAKWGGTPTTAFLRHSDNRLPAPTKARYHERLRQLGKEFQIPTASEEAANPQSADEMYASAVDELRRRAKSAGVTSVHRENISYGFARNLLGLKPLGVGICAAALVILLVVLWIRTGGDVIALSSLDAGIFAVLVVDLLVWMTLVTPKFVRHQADAYAQALLETAMTIPARH